MRGWGALSEKWRAVPKKSPKFRPRKKYVIIDVFGVFFHKNNEKHTLEAIGHRKNVENFDFRLFSVTLKNYFSGWKNIIAESEST